MVLKVYLGWLLSIRPVEAEPVKVTLSGSQDGVLAEKEAELLRAIADTLDCPVPPFLRASGNAGVPT